MAFWDRKMETDRLMTALGREKVQFLVLYGRRRIGKSTLVRKVMDTARGDVYFLSDQTSQVSQRQLFAKAVAYNSIPGFDDVIYPDWETLFIALNRQVSHRIVICLDEFPYMVKSCPALPSVLQKLIDGKSLKFDLIVCGSSQQLMQGYVLDRREPLFGRADEIMKLQPIPAPFLCEALSCDAMTAVEEYAVWDGIPRYWELRADYPDFDMAVRNLLLDPNGPLYEEPMRLLRDDMRDTVQTATILSIVGNGVHRISEIASRAGKDANTITEPLNRLRELGYVRREIPFGESEKKSKKGIYRINDNLLEFHYRFVAPYRSILELGRIDTVMNLVHAGYSQFVGDCWENMCRRFVSGNAIDGVVYGMASRWWGKIFSPDNKDGQMVELDVVTESLDKKHILIGECKWTGDEDAGRLINGMRQCADYLPFVKKGQTVHFVSFLKHKPVDDYDARVFLPCDVLEL